MSMEKSNYVAYYRVSTRRQEQSGLGLDAQQRAVREFVEARRGKVVAEFREAESGALKRRPELEAAIARARRQRAVLIVARLDRLARNLAFTAALLESGIDFIACDNPYCNRLTMHVLAAVAEYEHKIISARITDALASARKRGTKLGSARPGHWEGREDRRQAGLEKARSVSARSNRAAAVERYRDIAPRIAELRQQGLSFQAIAETLNEENIRSRRNARWSASQVRRVILRLKLDEQK